MQEINADNVIHIVGQNMPQNIVKMYVDLLNGLKGPEENRLQRTSNYKGNEWILYHLIQDFFRRGLYILRERGYVKYEFPGQKELQQFADLLVLRGYYSRLYASKDVNIRLWRLIVFSSDKDRKEYVASHEDNQ